MAELRLYWGCMEEQLEKQAEILCRYLVGQAATQTIKQQYAHFIQKDPLPISQADAKLLPHIDKHPWTIGIIDAALSLYDAESEVRRRLYVLFAILETSPDYYSKFLPTERNVLYLLFVGYSGLRGLVKAAFGRIWIWTVIR
jgi:hypothetical protein